MDVDRGTGPRILSLFGEMERHQALLDPREIGELVLSVLGGIDLRRPRVDQAAAADRLQAYVRALGVPAPVVRWAPDLRALREARAGADRGYLPGFSVRQSWLLDQGWAFPGRAERFPQATRVAHIDRIVLGAGLGSSPDMRPIRWVGPSLLARASQLAAGAVPAPKRVAALVPLAEAAAAGLFAFTVGREDDLLALSRPSLRLDSEGRLHDWDGNAAVNWPGGRGLYFWRGVEMTESAGRNPDRLTVSRVVRWATAERRRVAIERIGVEPFMGALGGRVVQQDDYGRLWRTEREIDGEPFVAVEVVNATEDPDGSRRRYFLRVPPDIRSARRAVAWTFGLSGRDYKVAVES